MTLDFFRAGGGAGGSSTGGGLNTAEVGHNTLIEVSRCERRARPAGDKLDSDLPLIMRKR